MKKAFLLLLTLLLLLSLSACGAAPEADVPADAKEPVTEKEPAPAESQGGQTVAGASEEVRVEKKDGQVVITLPASYFEGAENFDPAEYAEKGEYDSVVVNDDSSVTVTMSEERHTRLLTEMRVSLDASLSDLVGAESSPYVKAITPAENYQTVVVEVDKAAYGDSLDMTPLLIGISAIMYQQYAGIEQHCEVILRDAASGEDIASVVYPDSLY